MWIICAYYTKNTVYENHAKSLAESLERLDLSHEIIPIDNRGDWYANMQYKPTFLKQALERNYPHSVIYVDVDAIFYRYPGFFNRLEEELGVNIAVHLLNHSKYGRKNHPPELLSGTIFLKNTTETKQIIDEWIQECRKDPKLWDQRALATVLKRYKYHLLPEEYCTIFDYMSSVKNPVIKHFQASREQRRKTIVKRKRNPSTPRRVVQNGIVRIRRINKVE
ncbi:MAG: putative nucleotide-diphospho-sugar transferase [Nitrosopumilus sp.]